MISIVLALTVLLTLYGISISHLNQRLTRVQSFGGDEMRSRENRKVINMFVTIVCLFLILITPNSVMHMVQTYLTKFDASFFTPERYDLIHKLNIITYCIYSLSSIVNPWVYARKHKCVSRVLKRLWQNGRKGNIGQVIKQAIHETQPPRRGHSVGRMQPLSAQNKSSSSATLSQYLSTSTLRSSTTSICNLQDFDTRL